MISFDDLGPLLIERFPKSEWAAIAHSIQLDGPEREGAYVIFGSVLLPHLEQLFNIGDYAEVARVMDFIEELANQDDSRWKVLVQIELGEWIPSFRKRDDLEALAGPTTRMAIWKAERHLVQAERQANASPLISFIRKVILPKRRVR